MDIAKSIRHGLADVNKSKSWLALSLGVSVQYVGKMCNGEAVPSMKRIEEMANVFGVTVSELIKWGE